MEIKILKYKSEEYYDVLNLREKLLRLPLGLKFTERDIIRDADDVHIALYLKKKLIACLLLTPLNKNDIQMRQVAVEESYRKKGIGSRLVVFSEEYARQHGYRRMILHARKSAVPFYKKLKYKIQGKEFFEVSIPHYKMYKDLL